MKRGSL